MLSKDSRRQQPKQIVASSWSFVTTLSISVINYYIKISGLLWPQHCQYKPPSWNVSFYLNLALLAGWFLEWDIAHQRNAPGSPVWDCSLQHHSFWTSSSSNIKWQSSSIWWKSWSLLNGNSSVYLNSVWSFQLIGWLMTKLVTWILMTLQGRFYISIYNIYISSIHYIIYLYKNKSIDNQSKLQL